MFGNGCLLVMYIGILPDFWKIISSVAADMSHVLRRSMPFSEIRPMQPMDWPRGNVIPAKRPKRLWDDQALSI